MAYSNTDTYKMKREILNFTRNFSSGLSAPDVKFFADMTYGSFPELVAGKDRPCAARRDKESVWGIMSQRLAF